MVQGSAASGVLMLAGFFGHVPPASEDAAARIEALQEAEAAADDAATEKLRQAGAAAAARIEELKEAEAAARERAAADAATRAAELRDAEEASRKRLEALEKAEEEARARA